MNESNAVERTVAPFDVWYSELKQYMSAKSNLEGMPQDPDLWAPLEDWLSLYESGESVAKAYLEMA